MRLRAQIQRAGLNETENLSTSLPVGHKTKNFQIVLVPEQNLSIALVKRLFAHKCFPPLADACSESRTNYHLSYAVFEERLRLYRGTT